MQKGKLSALLLKMHSFMSVDTQTQSNPVAFDVLCCRQIVIPAQTLEGRGGGYLLSYESHCRRFSHFFAIGYARNSWQLREKILLTSVYYTSASGRWRAGHECAHYGSVMVCRHRGGGKLSCSPPPYVYSSKRRLKLFTSSRWL